MDVVVVVIISMIHMQKCVFLILLKTVILKYLIWCQAQMKQEAWKCQCRLDASVCNNKQLWNEGKCRCEHKELIHKGSCDKGFIWNPSNNECECDKSCDVEEYLDYENCKCIKGLADKLVEECSKNIEKKQLHSSKVVHYETLNKIRYKGGSSKIYITSFAVTIIIEIIIVIVYF